jgi:hypothetical protein
VGHDRSSVGEVAIDTLSVAFVRYRRPLAVLFAVLLVVWSWLLVRRNEIPESFLGGYSWFDREMAIFIISKFVHLGVYAFFALFGGLLPLTTRGRVVLWVCLALHGIASEIGQMIGNAYFQTNRHGCIRDMLIDSAGIGLGAVAVWWLRK